MLVERRLLIPVQVAVAAAPLMTPFALKRTHTDQEQVQERRKLLEESYAKQAVECAKVLSHPIVKAFPSNF